MDYTTEEHAEAILDAVALVRAVCDGRDGDLAVIIDAQRDRVTSATALVLAGIAGGMLVRFGAAMLLVQDEEARDIVIGASAADIGVYPGMCEIIDRVIAGCQASLTDGG